MIELRTLPIRTQPLGGEALDSWLETIASSYTARFGDVLHHTGIARDFETRWMFDLTRDELGDLAAATGIPRATLAAMTLRHYHGHGLRITSKPGRLDWGYPWGRFTTGHSRSRYCPQCLADSGGRWQLAWRLGWSFACVTHHCLLVDLCPRCHRRQRAFTHPHRLVPIPGHCALTINKQGMRCGADLSEAATIGLPDAHPIIDAQHVINTVLTGSNDGFGIYGANPAAAETTLHDIAVIAARVAICYAQHPTENNSPAELVAAYASNMHRDSIITSRRVPRRPGILAPDSAVHAAVQAAAAVTVVAAPTVADAGTLLVANTGRPTVAGAETALRWGLQCSEALEAVQIKGFSKSLSPALQLRYRASQPVPHSPEHEAIDVERVARHLPSALWPQWSIRFDLPASLHQRWRCAAASAVLLVGSRISAPSALERLHNDHDPGLLTRFLNYAVLQPNWASLSTAIIRLADFLNTHETPIDYDRRRTLDYRGLLPDDEWERICVATGALPGNGIKADIARYYLFRRISGLMTHPSIEIRPALHNRVLDFPLVLTPELASAFNQVANTFLQDYGIAEPYTWHPPLDILCGLNLQSTEIERTDLSALTSAAAEASINVTRIAKRLNISVDTTRYLLEQNPLNPVGLDAPGSRRDLISTNRRRVLTAETLNKLYYGDGWSIAAIARHFRMDYNTISRLARRQGIRIRPNETYVDRDWLFENYVVQRRTQQAMAAELGMSTPTFSNWVQRHGIALPRPETPAVPITETEAHLLLAPTLRRPGGRQHLQNFARAVAFHSVTDASRALGINSVTLGSQLRILKRDMGGPLLFRSTLYLPMALTPLGSRVLQAFEVLESQRAKAG